MKTLHDQKILAYLAQHGSINHLQAERLLNLSPATIRRIFQDLSDQGYAVRIHGGLKTLFAEPGRTVPIFQRDLRQAHEKDLLALHALEYFDSRRLNIIHGGTTTQYLAKYITAGNILTDSVRLAELLDIRFPTGGGPALTIVGGKMDAPAGFLYGPMAERNVRSYSAACFITSVRGLDEKGLLETDERSAGIMQAMMEVSARTIVLADHTKFGIQGDCRLADWSKVDVLITSECEHNQALLEQLRRRGIVVDIIPIP